MNWFDACRCGCGMPAPLSNRISAIEAPVSSLRHSIFSWMPASDFARHGICSDWIRISARLGASGGMFIDLARVLLKRDDFSSNRHHALVSSYLSMIFSENRYPLFGIML